MDDLKIQISKEKSQFEVVRNHLYDQVLSNISTAKALSLAFEEGNEIPQTSEPEKPEKRIKDLEGEINVLRKKLIKMRVISTLGSKSVLRVFNRRLHGFQNEKKNCKC